MSYNILTYTLIQVCVCWRCKVLNKVRFFCETEMYVDTFCGRFIKSYINLQKTACICYNKQIRRMAPKSKKKFQNTRTKYEAFIIVFWNLNIFCIHCEMLTFSLIFLNMLSVSLTNKCKLECDCFCFIILASSSKFIICRRCRHVAAASNEILQ